MIKDAFDKEYTPTRVAQYFVDLVADPDKNILSVEEIQKWFGDHYKDMADVLIPQLDGSGKVVTEKNAKGENEIVYCRNEDGSFKTEYGKALTYIYDSSGNLNPKAAAVMLHDLGFFTL